MEEEEEEEEKQQIFFIKFSQEDKWRTFLMERIFSIMQATFPLGGSKQLVPGQSSSTNAALGTRNIF